MALDVSRDRATAGVSVWSAGADFAVGAYRRAAGAIATERLDVERHYCFGLSDTPWEVEVEGEGEASVGPDIVRFHNIGDRIRSTARPADGCAETWVVLSPERLEAILGEGGGDAAGRGGRSHRPFPRSFVKAPLPDLAALRAFLRRVERGACPFWVEEGIAVLLPSLLRANAYRAGGAGPLSGRQRALVRDADALLVRHYAGEISLDALAGALGVTAPHLARIYRKEMGHGMHARLTALRLAAALRCLGEGTADLTGLALDLGFSSHSHFTAAFRRWIGAPPSAFRALCGGDQIFDSAALH